MTFTTNLPLRLMLILGLFACQNLTAQTYCASKGNLPWTEWIASVKIGTLNNASNKEGYGNFTSQTTNLTQGTSYPLSITQGFSWAPDPANAAQQGRVWIDYNKNGTFEATELVASFTRTTTTANVVVPTTALTGATRMRVSLKTIGTPTACEVFDKGEVEDYTVNIQGGTTQSCANNALNFDGVNDQVVSSRTVIPANADFTLEASFISTATSTGCSGAFRRLLVFDLGSSLNRFEIGDCAGQLTLYYYFGNVDELVNIPNATTLRNGNWHHVSVVKQGTNLMIYYDGTLVLTRPNMGGVNPVARQLIVGSWVQPIENWEGSIDEVKVWNYAMTAAEVQSKRLCQPTGTEANLLLYYPFSQGISGDNNTAITTILDKSLSANNGALRNFTLTGSISNFVCSNLALTACNTAVALPDLVPDYFRISGYTVDRTTTLSEVAVTNRGSASFPITNLHVFISRDSVYPSGRLFLDLSVTGIAAGGTYQSSGQRLLLDTFQAGVKYYTIAVIDPNNAVAESNESNNVWISKGVVYKNVVVTNADLALSITATPSVYRIYTTHNFKISVANNGTTAFTNVKIKFIRPALTVSGGTKTVSIGTFQDYCPGGIECSEWTIPSLTAGATATLDVPVFILAPTGGITATATLLSATPTDNITANNTASITVNSATAAQAPISQALAFRVPTQLIPVIIQRISPNPTEGDVQIKLDSWTRQTVDFNFADITGKIIYSEKRDLEKGMNRLDFEVFHLPQGVYFIQTNVGKGKDVPTKFVKM